MPVILSSSVTKQMCWWSFIIFSSAAEIMVSSSRRKIGRRMERVVGVTPCAAVLVAEKMSLKFRYPIMLCGSSNFSYTGKRVCMSRWALMNVSAMVSPA